MRLLSATIASRKPIPHATRTYSPLSPFSSSTSPTQFARQARPRCRAILSRQWRSTHVPARVHFIAFMAFIDLPSERSCSSKIGRTRQPRCGQPSCAQLSHWQPISTYRFLLFTAGSPIEKTTNKKVNVRWKSPSRELTLKSPYTGDYQRFPDRAAAPAASIGSRRSLSEDQILLLALD